MATVAGEYKEAIILSKDLFSARKPRIIDEERFRQYAVFIPILEIAGATYLLFEKRSDQLRHQPGEICFPGGKLEVGESMEACAVRETIEELEVNYHQIEVIGPGDIYISPFNIMIHPFIGRIRDYHNTYSQDEVDTVIKIPFEFFQNHKPEVYKSRLINKPPEDFPYEWIPGGTQYSWAQGTYDILFYQYESWIIWGLTAQIAASAVSLIETYGLI